MRTQARVLRGFGWGMVVIVVPVAPATAEVRDVPCSHTLAVEPWNGPVCILAATRASCTRDHSSSDHIHKAQLKSCNHAANAQAHLGTCPVPPWLNDCKASHCKCYVVHGITRLNTRKAPPLIRPRGWSHGVCA